MEQDFHFADIKFLLEAVTKHLLWNSEYLFLENILDLRAYINKAGKTPTVAINKEPH